VTQRGLWGQEENPSLKMVYFIQGLEIRDWNQRGRIISCLIKISNEDQGPTRRGPQGSTFTNKINNSFINVFIILARVPRWIDKARHHIIIKPTKEEGEELPQNIFPSMVEKSLQWIDLVSL